MTPGLIESEMTKGKFLNKEGRLKVDQDLRDVSSDPNLCLSFFDKYSQFLSYILTFNCKIRLTRNCSPGFRLSEFRRE